MSATPDNGPVSALPRLFAEAEPWEHALPRLVCYIMSVKDDVTAQELNEDFRRMLGSERETSS